MSNELLAYAIVKIPAGTSLQRYRGTELVDSSSFAQYSTGEDSVLLIEARGKD